MEADIRDTAAYAATEAWLRAALEPGFGLPMAAHDLDLAPAGDRVLYAAPVMTSLEAPAEMRVYATELATGETAALTAGPGDDRTPRHSPDGATIAFLSDRDHRGRFALHLLVDGVDRLAGDLDGSVEWLAWAADGGSLLLGVAGTGAEQAGIQGARVTATDESRPDWLPAVRSTDDQDRWRRLWVHDVAGGESRVVSPDGLTVWEACWAGPRSVLAVVSEDPGEGGWYTARLVLVDVATGAVETAYAPRHQLGWLAASPQGRCAFVEAVCSDRMVVAGDALVLVPGEAPRRLATADVDVTRLRWLDESRLLFAGLRGLDAVIGCVDVDTGAVDEWWVGEEGSPGGYVDAVPLTEGTALLSAASFTRPPELAIVGRSPWRTVHSFAHTGSASVTASMSRVERRRWASTDGTEIEGLLALPGGDGPYATVLQVHGGPIGASRPQWQVGLVPLLVSRGYAVLMSNPRGSQGRGQDFAAAVVGDLGGAETDDQLTGLDALVADGTADPARLGVQGGSHGGFMAAWLVTQTDRFAAAVPAVPICDWTSTYWTTNIAAFCTLFLGGTPHDLPEVYRDRSPVTHAARVRTPTFLWAGAEDHCCPPSQSVEMFQALQEQGVPSAVAVYPGEGHGVRRYPAFIDVNARTLAWFDRWMAATPAG